MLESVSPTEQAQWDAVVAYIRRHHNPTRWGACLLAMAVLSTEFLWAPRTLAGQVEAARTWMRTAPSRAQRIRDRTDSSVAALVAEAEEVMRSA